MSAAEVNQNSSEVKRDRTILDDENDSIISLPIAQEIEHLLRKNDYKSLFDSTKDEKVLKECITAIINLKSFKDVFGFNEKVAEFIISNLKPESANLLDSTIYGIILKILKTR